MSVQYTGDIMSTVEDIIDTLGCSVHWGDIMSTPGEYHEYTGGYQDTCRGRSLWKQLNLYGNPSVLNSPGTLTISHTDTHTHSSWYPYCTHDIPPPPPPPVYWTSPVYCTDIMQGVINCSEEMPADNTTSLVFEVLKMKEQSDGCSGETLLALCARRTRGLRKKTTDCHWIGAQDNIVKLSYLCDDWKLFCEFASTPASSFWDDKKSVLTSPSFDR